MLLIVTDIVDFIVLKTRLSSLNLRTMLGCFHQKITRN